MKQIWSHTHNFKDVQCKEEKRNEMWCIRNTMTLTYHTKNAMYLFPPYIMKRVGIIADFVKKVFHLSTENEQFSFANDNSIDTTVTEHLYVNGTCP